MDIEHLIIVFIAGRAKSDPEYVRVCPTHAREFVGIFFQVQYVPYYLDRCLGPKIDIECPLASQLRRITLTLRIMCVGDLPKEMTVRY